MRHVYPAPTRASRGLVADERQSPFTARETCIEQASQTVRANNRFVREIQEFAWDFIGGHGNGNCVSELIVRTSFVEVAQRVDVATVAVNES